MSQLDQLIGYLEREGVTEIVAGVGRPLAMRNAKGFVNLTARPMTSEQLTAIVRGTPLEAMIPDHDVTTAEPVDVAIGTRRVRVQIGRRGDEILLRLSRAGTGAVGPPPAAARRRSPCGLPPAAVERSRTPSAAPAAAPSPLSAPAWSSAPAPAVTSPLSAPARSPAPAAPVRFRPGNPAPAEVRAPAASDVRERDAIDIGGGGLDLEPLEPLDLAARDSVAPAARDAVDLAARDAIDLGPLPELELHVEPPRKPGEAFAPTPTFEATGGRSLFDGSFASLVRIARERGATDLHVGAGRVPAFRKTDLIPLEGAAPLTAEEAEALLLPLLDDTGRAQLTAVGYVDFALEAPDGGRLRANICRQQLGLKGTFRLALPAALPLDALGLPAELSKVVAHHQGFVVIAGPSGHGKTTTLAALVDLVNSTKPYHVLTIEDPIELVHPRKQAVISQREVGRHTESFARGLKASLREDPDVIVIGELRDRESVEIALTAAETGHLVLATMSTPSAAKTIDRLIDMFPPEEHSQVRASVAGALRAIVAQRLVPKKGGGVVPAIELVTGVLPLAVLIRDDKLYQLPNLMQRGRQFGMIRFDESLADLVRTGVVDEETALGLAESRKDFAALVQSRSASIPKLPGAR